MGDLKHLSVHQWIRSAIPDSQQPTSPVRFLFLKLPPPPCAVLLVLDDQYFTISYSPTNPWDAAVALKNRLFSAVMSHWSAICRWKHLSFSQRCQGIFTSEKKKLPVISWQQTHLVNWWIGYRHLFHEVCDHSLFYNLITLRQPYSIAAKVEALPLRWLVNRDLNRQKRCERESLRTTP